MWSDGGGPVCKPEEVQVVAVRYAIAKVVPDILQGRGMLPIGDVESPVVRVSGIQCLDGKPEVFFCREADVGEGRQQDEGR